MSNTFKVKVQVLQPTNANKYMTDLIYLVIKMLGWIYQVDKVTNKLSTFNPIIKERDNNAIILDRLAFF